MKKSRPQVGLSVDELCEAVHDRKKPGPKTKVPVVETGKEVRKTNRLYLSIKAIGTLDEKGKSIFSVGYSGKIAPPPDRGLGILILLMDELKQFISYSSIEAAEKDLNFLKDYVNGFEITAPPKDDEDAKSCNRDGV
jgi:hypothetical protein